MGTHNVNSSHPVVLHISAGLGFGGVETHLRLIATSQNKRFEHRFCAIMRGGVEAEAIALAGAKTYVLNVDPWSRPLPGVAALFRLMRETQPDIVHCHGVEGNLFGLPAAWLARIPIRIGEEIGIPDHSAKTRLVLGVIYRTAKRVIGVSGAVREWLIASGEVPASKAIRLYNPVAMSRLVASPRPAGSPLRIAFLGRLHPIKNVPALVHAMALVPSDIKAELHIIGDGPQRGEIEQLVRDLGLQDRVIIHGFSSSPSEQLATCHLYVQPSLAEGFGIAVVEAMSCGLPAIVSDHGGMPEIVVHQTTGWVLGSTDPKNLADVIVMASRLDELKLAQMGSLARQSVEKRFSVERYITDLEQLYENCGR